MSKGKKKNPQPKPQKWVGKRSRHGSSERGPCVPGRVLHVDWMVRVKEA